MIDLDDSDRIFDLADLGLDVPVGDTDFTEMVGQGGAVDPHDPRLVPGSVAAHCLHSVFSGTPVTIVQSPPGAGKSSLIAAVTNYLLKKTTLSVQIVAPTNNACMELATKIAAVAGPNTVAVKARGRDVPAGVLDIQDLYLVDSDGHVVQPDRYVSVLTVHTAKIEQPSVDLLISEESYQVTYGNFAEAADNAEQVLMVGDPGQIGPVVTHDVAPWRGIEDAPAARAPEVLARMDARVLTLPSTFRIGPRSTEAVLPLYPFSFRSERLPKAVDGLEEIERLIVDPALTPLEHARILTSRAASLVGQTLRETQMDGSVVVRPLEQEDVCVVAARNNLVAPAAADLASRGLGKVHVGTADSLQGGQWHAVVAMDPLASARSISQHALDNGRLCVMISRHMSHLTWVHADDWKTRIHEHSRSHIEADRAITVRERLTASIVAR